MCSEPNIKEATDDVSLSSKLFQKKNKTPLTIEGKSEGAKLAAIDGESLGKYVGSVLGKSLGS